MKKIIAFMIAVMMFIMPVLSFAEEATDTSVSISVNEEVLKAMVGEEAAVYAAIIEAVALVFHIQENQFRTMINFSDFTIADLVVEMVEQGIVVGSNLIDDNAIMFPYEDLQAMFDAAVAENQAKSESAMDWNFDRTIAAAQEYMVMDAKEITEWEYSSDPATSEITISYSPDAFMKVMDAVYEDIRESGLAETVLGVSEGADLDAAIEQAKKEVQNIMPQEGDFITIELDANDEGDFVYGALTMNYMENEFTDVEAQAVTNEDGEQNVKLDGVYELKAKTLIIEFDRTTTDGVQEWGGSSAVYTEGESESPYMGLSFIAGDVFSGVFCVGTLNVDTNEVEEIADISLVIGNEEDPTAFEFVASNVEQGDASEVLRVKGASIQDGYTVALYIIGFEDAIGTLTMTSVPAETLPSIADKTLINYNDLDEETLNRLGEIVMNNISSMFGGLLGSAE